MRLSIRSVGMIGKYLSIGSISLHLFSVVWFTIMTFDKLCETSSSEQAAELSSFVKLDIFVSEILIGFSIVGLAVWATTSGILMYRKRSEQ